jgi:hypothetical protein
MLNIQDEEENQEDVGKMILRLAQALSYTPNNKQLKSS